MEMMDCSLDDLVNWLNTREKKVKKLNKKVKKTEKRVLKAMKSEGTAKYHKMMSRALEDMKKVRDGVRDLKKNYGFEYFTKIKSSVANELKYFRREGIYENVCDYSFGKLFPRLALGLGIFIGTLAPAISVNNTTAESTPLVQSSRPAIQEVYSEQTIAPADTYKNQEETQQADSYVAEENSKTPVSNVAPPKVEINPQNAENYESHNEEQNSTVTAFGLTTPSTQLMRPYPVSIDDYAETNAADGFSEEFGNQTAADKLHAGLQDPPTLDNLQSCLSSYVHSLVNPENMPKDNQEVYDLTKEGRETILNSSLDDPTKAAALAIMYSYAREYLNVPYHYGGSMEPNFRSVLGFDCTGLMNVIMQEVGTLSKDKRLDTQGFMAQTNFSSTTIRDGNGSSRFKDYESMKDFAQRGDLIVWDGHIAMYLGDGQFIHSTRIDIDGDGYEPNELIGVVIEGPKMLDRLYAQHLGFKVLRPDYQNRESDNHQSVASAASDIIGQ